MNRAVPLSLAVLSLFGGSLMGGGLATALSVTTAQAQERGPAIFADVCGTCHVEHMTAAEAAAATDLIAPPMNQVITLVREKTGNSEDAFLAYVIDFTQAPEEGKIKAIPAAVEQFGMMTPIFDLYPDLPPADVETVARWLYGHYDHAKELADWSK